MALWLDMFVCLGELNGALGTGKGIFKCLFLPWTHRIGCPIVPVVFFFVAAMAPTRACHVRYGSGFWPVDHASNVECRPIADILYVDFYLLLTPIQIVFVPRLYWNDR